MTLPAVTSAHRTDVVHFLLAKGILTPEEVVCGQVAVFASQTRNLIFRVTRRGHPSLFVKWMHEGDRLQLQGAKEAVAHAVLERFGPPDAPSEERFWPRLVLFAPAENVLVAEEVPAHRTFHDEFLLHARVPDLPLARLASALGRLHAWKVPAEEKARLPRALPWVFRLLDFAPESYFPGQASLTEVIRVAQGDAGLRAGIAATGKMWGATSLIHGDMKFVNVLVSGDRPVIVDWELADFGDPLWDIAGIFQSYLAGWLFSFDNQAPQSFTLPGAVARFDIARTRPQLALVWNAYAAGLASPPTAETLAKLAAFTALRLIQMGVEGAQSTPRAVANCFRCLQVAVNVLAAPGRAAGDLLGLFPHGN